MSNEKEQKYRYTPAQANERKQAKADYERDGFTVTEIPVDDGSGDTWLLLTPPKNDPLPTKTVPPSATGNAERDAMNFFVSQGWTHEQAAGIVANLQEESRLNPHIEGDSGDAYGIAQWHRDRQDLFKSFIGHSIKESSTFEEQLRFVQHELTTTEKNSGDLLRKAKTANDAGSIVSREYERPGDKEGAVAAKRGKRAEDILKNFH